MIRLLIIVVALVLFWVVFLSDFSRQRKIWVAVGAMLFSAVALWLESNWLQPKKDVVEANQIVDCGTTATHSYRTSFDLMICLRNQASVGRVKRVSFDVVASQCTAPGTCQELQRVPRELSIDLPAQTDIELKQNLQFNLVDPAATDLAWAVEVKSVRATAK